MFRLEKQDVPYVDPELEIVGGAKGSMIARGAPGGALFYTLQHMDRMNNGQGIKADDLRAGHPRLDESSVLGHRPAPAKDQSNDD